MKFNAIFYNGPKAGETVFTGTQEEIFDHLLDNEYDFDVAVVNANPQSEQNIREADFLAETTRSDYRGW